MKKLISQILKKLIIKSIKSKTRNKIKKYKIFLKMKQTKVNPINLIKINKAQTNKILCIITSALMDLIQK